MEQLSVPQHDILQLIHRYIEENDGRPPYRNNTWFEDKTPYQGNYITNIKRELRKRKYIDDNLRLTEKGKQYIRFFCGTFAVQGATFQVRGTARAALADDRLHIDLDELDMSAGETIVIPAVSRNKDSFAVRVEGNSLEAMGILSGDYVIVEQQDSLWWPAPQDLIVTKYLPHDPERDPKETPIFDDYVGPVVKVYEGRFGEKGCYLGWKKLKDQNPYRLKADSLIPTGKVIGVYRDYHNFQI